MPHHWDKMRVEEAVIESRLRWTILQPAPYVQNFNRPPDGILRVPYRIDAPFSFVDLRDVAEAAAIVLTGIAFDYGIYELAGPDVLTVADIARRLDVRVETVGSQQASARLKAMFEYYDRHGLVGNPTALAMILGRPPTSALDAVLRDLASGDRADH
jgi:nucleoside-diphosphate-sugar epimerase